MSVILTKFHKNSMKIEDFFNSLGKPLNFVDTPCNQTKYEKLNFYRSAAESILMQRRQKDTEHAESLKHWHQAYHSFRRSVHCFIEGLETMQSMKYQEALDLFTDSYHYTIKASEIPVTVSLDCIYYVDRVTYKMKYQNFRNTRFFLDIF